MLQQTQVDTVVPYFERFLRLFPDLPALAAAPLDQVLRCWEGLGYYSRARNLKLAAERIAERYDGRMPSEPDELERLPGIGRYTAGAIASIAFGRRVPILDGNVRRVLCRLYAILDDPRVSPTTERLWTLAAALLPMRAVADFNQALMELGALVCTPRQPDCSHCPIRPDCQAYRLGIYETVPARARRAAVAAAEVGVAVILGRAPAGPVVLMAPRPQRGLFGGLWGLPEGPAASAAEIHRWAQSETGLVLTLEHELAAVRRVYTHKRVLYRPFLLRCSPPRCPASNWSWVPLAAVETVPASQAVRRILDQITRPAPAAVAAEPSSHYRRRLAERP